MYRFGVVMITPPEPILSMGNRLRETHDPRSQAYGGAPACRRPFSPPMTIAEFVTGEESARMMAELPHHDLVGAFTCSYLSLAVLDDGLRFGEGHRLSLSGVAT